MLTWHYSCPPIFSPHHKIHLKPCEKSFVQHTLRVKVFFPAAKATRSCPWGKCCSSPAHCSWRQRNKPHPVTNIFSHKRMMVVSKQWFSSFSLVYILVKCSNAGCRKASLLGDDSFSETPRYRSQNLSHLWTTGWQVFAYRTAILPQNYCTSPSFKLNSYWAKKEQCRQQSNSILQMQPQTPNSISPFKVKLANLHLLVE